MERVAVVRVGGNRRCEAPARRARGASAARGRHGLRRVGAHEPAPNRLGVVAGADRGSEAPRLLYQPHAADLATADFERAMAEAKGRRSQRQSPRARPDAAPRSAPSVALTEEQRALLLPLLDLLRAG